MKKFDNVQLNKVRRIFKAANLFFGIILVVTFALRIYESDSTATAGKELSQIEDQLESQLKKNEKLNDELLQKSSYASLFEIAQEKGYTDSDIEYYTSFAIASNQ